MSNRWMSQFWYSLHKKPVTIDCNFIIDAANANGLGQRTLKGAGINQVFCHSSTPATGNNVPTGFAQIFFDDSYYYYYGGFTGFVSPVTGSTVAGSLSASTVYVIKSLGTTTQAQWVSAGLSSLIPAAVGVSFIANGTSGSFGTGTCATPTKSGVTSVEVVGNANLTLNTTGPTGTGYIIVQFLGSTSSSVTTLIATQPADGSTVGMSFDLSNSFVTVNGD